MMMDDGSFPKGTEGKAREEGTMETADQIKVLMIDDDELIARSTTDYFTF